MQLVRTSLGIEAADAALLVTLLADGRRRAERERWTLSDEHRRLLDHLDALARAHRARTSEPVGSDRKADDGHAANVQTMTTTAAATLLGCTERNVIRLVDRNVIGARKVRGRWHVDPADVHTYKEHCR
jgi:excisionase family DNA binding protein